MHYYSIYTFRRKSGPGSLAPWICHWYSVAVKGECNREGSQSSGDNDYQLTTLEATTNDLVAMVTTHKYRTNTN